MLAPTPSRGRPPPHQKISRPGSLSLCSFFLPDFNLAAQCEITPHIAQYPFEIASQRGYRTLFASFSCGIAQVSLRYPFVGGRGGIAPPLHMLSKGKKAQKGGYRAQLVMLRHQKPHSTQEGDVAEIVSRYQYGATKDFNRGKVPGKQTRG